LNVDLSTIDPVLVAGIAGGAVLLLVLLSVRRVPQGFEYTVERFGRFRRLLGPGLRFVLPLADRIGARQDMRERHLALPKAEYLTQDRVPLQIDAAAFWQIQDAARASYEVEDLETSLRALLTVSLRTLIGERDLDEVTSTRAALNARLLTAVEDAASVWGVSITRTELAEVTPPAALVAAVESARLLTVAAEAKRAAAEDEAQARRIEAEAERDAQRLAAKARADTARIDAASSERVAEGDARATLMLSRAVSEGDGRALNYLLARRYVDTLKLLAQSDNSRLVVLPLENGGLTTSLSGIRELAEATFADLDEPAAESAMPRSTPTEDAGAR